jgi:hypothetical protein
MSWNRLHESIAALPTILVLGEDPVRWIGPLMDRGFQVVLEDMGDAAWGYLEYCGWQELLPEGDALDADGKVREAWLKALLSAAARLAERGGESGPTGDRDLWLSWLFLSAGSAAALRRHWEAQGVKPLQVAEA